MPLVLIAGTIVAQPKAENFPERGRPRCEVRVKVVEGDGTAVIFRIVGYEEQCDELEVLAPGDSICVQGQLQVESKAGRLTGLFVIAGQVMALRRRSINRLPAGCAPRAAAAL